MKILHPDYNESLDLEALKAFESDGVYSIIAQEDRDRLAYFLNSFEKFRAEKKQRITDESLYPTLPFSINDKSWQSKQQDLKIIDKICKNKTSLKILDIGAWNGWLSNCLAQKGHQVVATDIFSDEYDGLKAIKHYKSHFTALQILPEDLWRIQETFDLIIFNRNWAYFENPEKMFSLIKDKLAQNGTILFTGLTFYRNPEKIKQQMVLANEAFQEQYGIPLLFFPSKGYLDQKDFRFLKQKAEIYPYHYLTFSIKKLLQYKMSHQFAIYQNHEAV